MYDYEIVIPPGGVDRGFVTAAVDTAGELFDAAGVTMVELRGPHVGEAPTALRDEPFYDGRLLDREQALTLLGMCLLSEGALSADFETRSGFRILIHEQDVHIRTFEPSPDSLVKARSLGLDFHAVEPQPDPDWTSFVAARTVPADAGFFTALGERLAGGERAVVIEQWAYGFYGQRGYVLVAAEDLAWLRAELAPRSGLAVFWDPLLLSSDQALAHAAAVRERDGDVQYACMAGEDPEQDGDRGRLALSFDQDDVIDWLEEQHGPVVVVPLPEFPEAWLPPAVDVAVRPDADGVIRSRMEF